MAKTDWPPKLPPNFELTVTKWGYVKTLNGKTHWICGKKTPREARAIYFRKATSIASDRKPMPEAVPAGQVTIHYILARWINNREIDLHEGKLNPNTFSQYRRSSKRIDAVVGHYTTDQYHPDMTEAMHRQIVKKDGPDAARRAISHWRDCCRYAEDRNWCQEVRIGRSIVRRLVKLPRSEMKWKLNTVDELRIILGAAGNRCVEAKRSDWRAQAQQFYAMLLLSLNGGYGGMELAQMTREMVDLAGARISGRRGKTGVMHTCPLWPETVVALRPVMRQRPEDDLVFRTRQKHAWVYYVPKMDGSHAVACTGNDNFKQRWDDLVKPLGLKVNGQGPYKLRHLHATTADAFGDPNAQSILMGHKLPGSKGHYIKVGEERLRGLVEFIRQKLEIPSICQGIVVELAGSDGNG